MATDDEIPAAMTASEKLARLVASRKAAAAARGSGKDMPGQRRSERAAAAISASKSKPALRK